jgi:hypothetical protein
MRRGELGFTTEAQRKMRGHRGRKEISFLPLCPLILLCASVVNPLSLLASFEMEPWFGNVWEFNFTPTYTYSRYRDVQNGHPQLKSASNDQLLDFNLTFSPVPEWEFAGDVEFADTPRQSMGLRSFAMQGRYLWLNDVVGDAVSFTTGLSARGVSRHSLKDVSCPYHFHANVELNASIGREWSQEFCWHTRLWGFGAIGMANRGNPWTRAAIVLEKQWAEAHRLSLFSEAYVGLGGEALVNTDRFNGYARIHHRSVDVGAAYTYIFEVWGRISVAYTRRVFARSFPENVNFFTVRYTLPFSLL